MKFLQEAMKTYKRLDSEDDRKTGTPALSLEVDPQDDVDSTETGTPEDLALDDDLESEAHPEGTEEEFPDLDDDEPTGEEGDPNAEGDFDFAGSEGGGFGGGGSGSGAGGAGGGEAQGDEQDPMQPDDGGDPAMDGEDGEQDGDPDKQGLIRTVPNAHLVFKRETADGSFEELWVYNVSELRGSMDTRKAILAGTDIPTNKTKSPDGNQTYELWSAGNAEMLMITGLQN